MIKAIFIDVDDTLLDFGACAKEAIRGTMAEFGMAYEERVLPVFFRVNEELWLAIERGELTREELWQRRWNLIFTELGIGADGVAFEERFHQRLNESAVPIEGAVELVDYLAKRYLVCVTTNSTHTRQQIRLAAAGMMEGVRHIFSSERIGASKPSPQFFAACFAALPDIRPEETMIIGDSLTADISGGLACGMQTCWFNPGDKALPEGWKIDHVVHTLGEIKEFL